MWLFEIAATLTNTRSPSQLSTNKIPNFTERSKDQHKRRKLPREDSYRNRKHRGHLQGFYTYMQQIRRGEYMMYRTSHFSTLSPSFKCAGSIFEGYFFILWNSSMGNEITDIEILSDETVSIFTGLTYCTPYCMQALLYSNFIMLFLQ